MKNLFLIAVIVLGFSAASFAQIGVTATAATSATIITPLSIAKVAGADLMFGNIAANLDGGTVTVAPDGARSATGLTLQAAIAGTVQAAQFTVSGLADATYSITLPADFTVTGPVGSTPMSISSFISNPATSGTLAGGTQIIQVGATLTLNASQAAGTYTNADALVVTVSYN